MKNYSEDASKQYHIQVGKCELVETEAGMIYLDVAGSAVLIQAPEDITSLDELDLPDLLGQPQYSQKQICAMQGYTLDQLKDAIYTVPDMIQYLVETNYGENPVWENDVHFSDGSYEWAINKSAAGAKDSDCPSCGAVSNLTRCILEGDYDDCGYILWGTYDKDKNETNGGHVINFYQVGNQYVTFDYTSVSGGSFRPNGTNCWVVGSTKASARKSAASTTLRAGEEFLVFICFLL